MQENHSLIENKDSGTVHYELRIDKDDVKAMYWIRPQINLGQKDGIAYSTRVDFLIVCGEYLYKGKDYHKDIPKIALYLDGYQYHASNEHNVFEKDINIRQAIVAQPEYRSWTLTWNDLDRFVEYMEDRAKSSDLLSEHYQAYFQIKYLEILLSRMVSGEKINYAFPHNNVLRLWHQLLYPQIKIFESSWFTYLGSWTKEMFNPSFDPSKLSDLIDGTLSDGNYIRENRITDFNALLPVEYESKFGFANWSIWVNIGKRTLYHHLQLQTGAEVDKGEWENFWHLFNLFQFSTSFTVEMETDVNAIFKEISDYYSQSYHPLLQKAIEAGYIHDGNYEMLDSLIDEDGNLIADASLILTAIKIAVDPYTDESLKILESLGYTIYSEKQLNEIEL